VKLLVSAGPTREFFDSVRFISNPSSGRMGYAIAREAARRGHEVALVSGPVTLKPPKGVNIVRVTTAAEMARACKRAFRQADVAVMTAAVCDYRPAQPSKQKLAKQARAKRVLLEPTEDIAATLGRSKGNRILVAFAMEDHDAPCSTAPRTWAATGRLWNCSRRRQAGPSRSGDRSLRWHAGLCESSSRRYSDTEG